MNPPTTFTCPILHELMRDPVLASDGFSYERAAIGKWFSLGKRTSPITNEPLECTAIFPNRALKSTIQDYVVHQRQLMKHHLLDELRAVRTNAAYHEAANASLLQYSLVSVGGAVLDTYSILHAIFGSWKEDAEVCGAAVEGLVRMVDTSDDQEANRIHQLDFFSVVMDVMRRFDHVSTVQACGLKYIQRYSTVNGFLKAACIQKYRACDMVVAAMKQHAADKDVQVQGFHAMKVLGTNFPSTAFKSGVSKVLLSASELFSEDVDVVLAICHAVQRLTGGACSRLCHGGLCRKLADAMLFFPRNNEVQKHCCLVLAKISHSKTHCDESVCDVVVACLQEGLRDVEIANAACAAMARLAFWRRNATRFGDNDGCDMALTCLGKGVEEGNEDLVANALHALEHLTSQDETNRLALSTKQACTRVVQTLEASYEHRHIVLSALKTLYNASTYSAQCAKWCEEEAGASKQVVRAMRSHLGDEELQEVGWSLLDLLNTNLFGSMESL
jgi:hypothetical protein